ncbi:MAG: cation transporter [Candidatus Omnitrophica bacterium]|nr:cation transporter [Candidatus Omnitrophota bacterium]
MSIHPHRPEGPSGTRELRLALLITASFMLVELVAGLISGSLALLADAGHMFTDASALALSLFAAWIATKPATPGKSFGYYRTEILAALVNGVALWLLVILIYVRAPRPRGDAEPQHPQRAAQRAG